MNLDYLSNEFHKQVVELVNNCQLPPTLAYYILRDITDQIQDLATQSCMQVERELLEGKETTKTAQIPLEVIDKDKDG